MNKSILTILSLLFLLPNSFAQNYSFELDVDYDFSSDPYYYKGGDDLSFNGRKVYANAQVHTDEGRYLIYASQYSKKQSTLLAYAEIDEETNQVGALKSLESDYDQIKMNFKSYSNFSSVNGTFQSPSKKKYAWSYVLPSENKGYALHVDVWDNKMSLENHYMIDLTKFDEKLVFEDILITDDGSILLFAKLDPFGKNEQFQVFKLTDEDFETLNIELAGNKEILEAYFYQENINNEIVISGFYQENSNKLVSGSFIVKIKDLQVVLNKSHPFDEDINIDYKLKDHAFELKDFINLEDGGFLMTAERTHDFTINNNGYNMIYFVSLDILVFRFNASGDLVFSKNIDKRYRSANQASCSFETIVKSSGYYFLFNDVKSLEERKRLYKVNGKFARHTDLVKMNKDGSIAYQETFHSSNESEYELFPRYSKNLENDKILLTFYQNRDKIYGYLTVK